MKFPEMEASLRGLCFLAVLFSSLGSFALDREAFSITNYDLNLQIDPEQHRLGARGKITLRNDTPSPQKIAVLQISSSLDWRSIKVAGKAVQYVTQPHTSDIDHTGGLSESIVTFPEAVAPRGTIDLDIAYEGVILLDATRLTRIGPPEDVARSTDWDEIGTTFTAVRGAGYVAWYPITTEVANLSEGDSLFEVLSRWKIRETGSQMKIAVEPTSDTNQPPIMVCSGKSIQGVTREGTSKFPVTQCTFDDLGDSVPSLALAKYGVVDRPSVTVYNLTNHAIAAEAYAEAAENIAPLIKDWFGPQREKAKVADLPDPHAAPFESGVLLLTPLANSESTVAGLAAAHQFTHASFLSFRPWIEEGLAHFAQALYVEQQKGRLAALDYMALHGSALGEIESPSTTPRSDREVNDSLVNTVNEELYRSKAMYVWWMLRDMLGDAGLKKSLAAYRPEQDKDPSYIARLISAQTHRDLGWFFDDWVYRDHGLPDFKVDAASPRKTLTDSFIVAVTVDNVGNAGAEVPVVVKFAKGEVVKRMEVRARAKATIRVETPSAPLEVVVNDGSVPESDVTNNTFKVETPEK